MTSTSTSMTAAWDKAAMTRPESLAYAAKHNISVEATVEGPFLFGLDFDDRGDVWANLPLGLFGVLERARVSLSGPFGGEKEFRFREAVLRQEDRIMVFGAISIEVDRAGRRAALRGPPLAYKIRGTATDPVALADADEDSAPFAARA